MLSAISALPLFSALPAWASALAATLAVMLAAALAGALVGRAWASVRYPDPEKQSVLDPRLRLLFIALVLLCAFWLYQGFSPAQEEEPGEALPAAAMDGPIDDSDAAKGGDADAAANHSDKAGGAVAAAVEVAVAAPVVA